MAEYKTARIATTGARTAVIDEALVAWAVGTNDALLAILRDPMTLRPNILGWIVMFAPLIMVFTMGAMINRLSAAGAQLFFYTFAAVIPRRRTSPPGVRS